jgi:hypothetical protein
MAEGLVYELCAAVDYLDEEFIITKVGKIRDSIRRGHPQPNILAWLYEFGMGCLGQLQFFRANPHIPMPTPCVEEAFVPWQEQQLVGVRDIVKKQTKHAAGKKQASLA